MLCKYSCKFNYILANYFSHVNYFPSLNLILVNITNTANSCDEVKRTALMCKRRTFAQTSPTAVIYCCFPTSHPFILITNNEDYQKRIIPKYLTRHSHKTVHTLDKHGNLAFVCKVTCKYPRPSVYACACVTQRHKLHPQKEHTSKMEKSL